jgi:dTDP-L-rhamnose 4-epimerase
MKRILVTGGAGFIGSHLADRLIAQGYQVTAFDNLDPQVHPGRRLPAYLNRKVRFVRGDVRDTDALKDAVAAADCIYHFASAVGVGQSQYEIRRYVDVNIGGTANLLDVLVNTKHRVRKLVIAASMSSYGEGL